MGIYKWTKEKDAYLEEAWFNMRVIDIAEKLGFSRDAILRRARKLKLMKKPTGENRPQYYDWTDEQDFILTKHYKTLSNDEMARMLGMSVQAVMRRMRKLGLSRGNDGTPHYQWTDDRVATLLTLFGQGVTQRKIAAQLGVSLAAVKRKIYSLELSKTHNDNQQKGF